MGKDAALGTSGDLERAVGQENQHRRWKRNGDWVENMSLHRPAHMHTLLSPVVLEEERPQQAGPWKSPCPDGLLPEPPTARIMGPLP